MRTLTSEMLEPFCATILWTLTMNAFEMGELHGYHSIEFECEREKLDSAFEGLRKVLMAAPDATHASLALSNEKAKIKKLFNACLK